MSNKCDFCGEGDRKNKIDNPNCDNPYFWYVCDFCKNYIKEKQDETLKIIIEDHKARMESRLDDALSESSEVGT